VIKEYFANYFLHMSDVTFDMANNRMEVHQRHAEPWRVTLVDTGESTMTGGRLRRVQEYLERRAVLLYLRRRRGRPGHDGAMVPSTAPTAASHVTAVQPPGRYGALDLRNGERGAAGLRKSPGAMAAGSTAAFSCCRPRWPT
jgi:glucose-1-phosphate cytidylyltransferase